MNDEKNSIGDQQILNFHIDQSKSKNANKLQKMVQHADSFSESLDNMKNGTEKKTNENHTKRQKSLCYDFKKGNCRRRFCRVSLVSLLARKLGNFLNNFFLQSKFIFVTVSTCDEF